MIEVRLRVYSKCLYMVNTIRFLKTVQPLWNGIARVNFMEVKGLARVGQSESQSGEIDYTN